MYTCVNVNGKGNFRHVGVCCPDDIALNGLTGSRLVMDLPAGGLDYEESEASTGKLSDRSIVLKF